MKSTFYHSAGFTIYPELGQIKSGDESLSLGLVNMKVLNILLQNCGEAVSRADIYEQVWGEQVVSDDALTRCISDIRSELGKYTSEALIETLPKRGYRWIADVVEKNVNKALEPESAVELTRKQYLAWITASAILIIVVFSISFKYLSTQRPEPYLRIALMPVQIENSNQQILANDLADILRKHLLETEQIRFLSDGALSDGLPNPYPYLSMQLGTQWTIEGKIREQREENYTISFSLVDASTGLVALTKLEVLKADEEQLEKFCLEFVNEIKQFIVLL